MRVCRSASWIVAVTDVLFGSLELAWPSVLPATIFFFSFRCLFSFQCDNLFLLLASRQLLLTSYPALGWVFVGGQAEGIFRASRGGYS